MTEDITRYLENHGIEYKLHADLSCISTMRVGGTALLFASPDSADKLCRLIGYLDSVGIKLKVTGRMSNILSLDEEYQGVIVNTLKLRTYSVTENIITADCGVYVPKMCRNLASRGISFSPELSSIPATVGGMLTSNAGAHGKEISDEFIDGSFFDRASKKTLSLKREDMGFSYRTSRLKNSSLVLLSARFKASAASSDNVLARIGELAEMRRERQPIEYPSLGSVFLRVDGVSAGKLIDEAGLKGVSVGGAEVSRKHAGFIVNRGGATARDVKALIDIVREKVFEHHGVWLDLEIEIL